MRSLVSIARTPRSGLSAWGVLAATVGISCLLVSSAAYATETLSGGKLSIPIGTLDPIEVNQTGSIQADVSRNGGNLVGVAFTEVIVATDHFIIPVTDPGAAPIKGIQATVMNAAADFATTPAPGFGGQMGLQGFNKVCLFGPCTAAVANIEVPVNVVGIGGTVFATAAVNLTVIGAPWTTMTVQIGTVTQMGAITTMGAVNHVKLVTPTFVSTNIAPSAIVPVFGVLDFNLSAPEPTTLAALATAVAALVSVGVSRRSRK
jgi:hypothetical protein